MTATTSRRTSIVPPKHAHPAELQANYGVKIGGAWLICAYGEEADALKQRFLEHGSAYLRAIGHVLFAEGFTEMEVRCEPSGMAGSGTVYAEYWHPDLTCWIYALLEATCLRV